MSQKKPKPTHWLFLKVLWLLFFIVFRSNGACMPTYQKATFTTCFVVIGTYQEESNAIRHVNQAHSYVKSAGYFFNDVIGSYYVFAFKSINKRITLNKLHELRTNPYFKEAWYYKHHFDTQPDIALQIVEKEAVVKKAQVSAPAKTDLEIAASEPKPDSAQIRLDPVEPKPDSMQVQADVKPEMEATNAENIITPPENTQSAADKLQTAETGDFVIFKNLIFHRNAAILQQSSASDLNKLLSIMRDNNQMKIRIHGHTNGDFRGQIITMGKKSKSYFKTNSKNNYLNGDAVMLSLERAKIIGRYLRQKGILPERIEIKGWGGEKTIYPANSVKSSLNSRVEIEILER